MGGGELKPQAYVINTSSTNQSSVRYAYCFSRIFSFAKHSQQSEQSIFFAFRSTNPPKRSSDRLAKRVVASRASFDGSGILSIGVVIGYRSLSSLSVVSSCSVPPPLRLEGGSRFRAGTVQIPGALVTLPGILRGL
ncbi:hypothetical protein TNIN_316701 [Trichonephila inaurata madagascariensis]|uniref:Uncharacterized protein n=1 Tax=Trichonephila inaurata madagascariensis TaxID=2747483 RepID=A0A8X6YUJ0_9ARAC|nr:hypothetical protein TNIN_316701 [Trichonephila inaurata madagascariensis]